LRGEEGELKSSRREDLKSLKKIGFIGRDSCPMNLIFVVKCGGVNVFNKILVAMLIVGGKIGNKSRRRNKLAMVDG